MQDIIDALSAEALRLAERLYEVRVGSEHGEMTDAAILSVACDDMLALQIELMTRPTQILWAAGQTK